MIGFLRGALLEKHPPYLLVDVHGVGYELEAPMSTFYELPEVGAELEQGADACVIESVKAAGEVKSPVAGVVTAVNESLVDEPGKVNEDPLGEGWFIRMEPADAAELDALMDQAAYDEYVENL